MDMCSLSRICTPVVSPVISDCDDTAELNASEKIERIENMQVIFELKIDK